MKTEDLERFQEMLEHMRAETLESLGRVQQEGRSMGEASRGDMGECSVTNFSREFAFQQSTRKRHALRNIEAALKRIKEGTFGRCMSCGGDILIARLRAMPFSAYCRACQENFEREQSVNRDTGSHIPKAPAERARPVRSISESDSSSKSDTA
jgi:DnaK suppressor protein